MIRIALVGDYNPAHVSHRAIPEALRLAGAAGVWMHTNSIGNLAEFDGVWCVPASPYANTQAALDAIRFAREARLPFLGSCGGFQHAVLEYARNVRGWRQAAHAENEPEAEMQLIAPLNCPLVERSGEIDIVADGWLRRAYDANRITEEYHCSYGLGPNFETAVLDDDMRATARDVNGEIRAVELDSHPFFVATLFQSERRALRGEVPPLVKSFISACASRETPA
jgi:CTP synthase (UTP-ammonia lyase)